MSFDLLFFALAIPAVIFAGVSKAGFGSGAAFAATPLLALVVEPGLAVGLMLPLLMLMDVTTLRPYWKKWHWPSARAMMIWAVPGVLAGAALYKVTNPDVFRFFIGLIAVAFVAFQLARARGLIRIEPRPVGMKAGAAAGITAGFTSFISHAGGPPVAIYLLAQGLPKTTFQATTVIVFWAINLFKVVPYAFLGIFTKETLLANLMLAPFAVIGVWLGVKAHHMVNERLFFGLTYIFLGVTGTKLIWDALT